MVCPNCGYGFEGERCPNCGRPAKGSGRASATIVFIFLVLPAGAMGTCSLVMGLPELQRPSGAGEGLVVLIFIMAATLLAFVASLIFCVRLWRS